MNFDKSILHSFQSWKLNNATLNNGVMTIKPNGNIQCIVYPRDKDESKIRESYQVIVTQGNKRGKLSFTFNNYLIENENLKLTSIVIYSENNINKVLKTETNITKQTVVIVENLSENDIEITNIELKPLSNIPIDIGLELNKYTTHIFKYSNSDEVIINQEKKVIANLNVELQETSNLLLQILVNGVSSLASTLTLDVTVNNKELEYSPILLDINEGNFLVGIPGNVMNMSEGENVVKVYATSNEGLINVNVDKIQVTLSGQNMMVIYGEDIWFGPSEDNDFDPCEHEVFTYDKDILFIEGGKLQVKCIEEQVSDMILNANLTYGNVYEFKFNIDKIRKYENVELIELIEFDVINNIVNGLDSNGISIAPEIVATIGTFLVASGCSIVSQKMLNDVTRKFYNDNEDNWDEVVETFKSSVKKVGNGMVSIGTAFLQLLSKSFDSSIDVSDNGGTYTYSGLFGDIPIVPNETDMYFKYDPTFGYAVTGDFEIGPFKFIKNGDSLDFYYEGTYRSTCNNFFSANRRLFVKSNYLIAYHNAGSFWGDTYWWVNLSKYNYTDYTLDMPLGYSKDKLKVDEEDGKLEVGIPGTLDQLLDGSVNYDNVYNPNYDTTDGNVGIGSLPGVSNPSIEYGDNITIPDEPAFLFSAYLYAYEGKYYTENDDGELIETITQELTDDLFLNEGVYSINSDLIKPNMKVLYYKVENKNVVPQVKYSGVYEGATITMEWDLQSEQGKTFNVLGDVYSDDNVRFLLSNDKGQTWLTFNGYEVVSCDINTIKDNGMTYDVFTSLNASQLQSFKGGTNSLRIAIYIEQYSVNGKTNIDHIRLRY